MTPDWHPEDEPFLRPYALHTADRLTEATVNLLRTGGVDALSVGALARAINVTPQAVLKDYPRAGHRADLHGVRREVAVVGRS